MSDKPIHEQIADNLYGSTDPFGNRIEPGPPFIQSEGAYGHAEPRRDKPRTARVSLGKLLGRHHKQMFVMRERCDACHNYSPTWQDVADAIEAEAAGRHDPEAVRLDVDRIARWLESAYGHAFRNVDWKADAADLARTATDGSGDE
jgi:hypothetical protein